MPETTHNIHDDVPCRKELGVRCTHPFCMYLYFRNRADAALFTLIER